MPNPGEQQGGIYCQEVNQQHCFSGKKLLKITLKIVFI